MQEIMLVLEEYDAQAHTADPTLDPSDTRYPATLTDPKFSALVPLVKDGKTVVKSLTLTDPWNRPYVYATPGEHGGDYDLATYGASGNAQQSGTWLGRLDHQLGGRQRRKPLVRVYTDKCAQRWDHDEPGNHGNGLSQFRTVVWDNIAPLSVRPTAGCLTKPNVVGLRCKEEGGSQREIHGVIRSPIAI